MLSSLLVIGCAADNSSDGPAANQADASSTVDLGVMNDGQTAEADAAVMDPVPNIEIDPTTLTLPGVAGMASESKPITISNTGDAALVINAITILPEEEAAHFAITGLDTFPTEIEPGGQVELAAQYTAPDPREHSATLTIESNDPDAPSIPVLLTGRILQTCFRTMPSAVDLGPVDSGIRSGRFEVRIINCGDKSHTIASITTDGDENFSWATSNGADPAGRVLDQGDSVSINVTYNNVDLIPDERATGRLRVTFTDNAVTPLSIPLSARGGSGQRCLIRAQADALDFEILRIGLTRTLEATITNHGTGPCDLREVSVSQTAGEVANPLSLGEVVEPGMMAAMTSRTIAVTYAPTVTNPVGERGVLTIAYHDEFTNMNRSEEVQLRGTGAEALIGSIPEIVDFDETTASACASRQLRIGAENVGFVPLCTYDFMLEGENCDRFFLLESPDFGDCLSLERGESASYLVQFEPTQAGRVSCDIVVSSDAQNTQAVALSLTGTGTETDARTDSYDVGELNPQRNAHWPLRLPAQGNSVRVFINDEAFMAFAYDADRNRITIEPENHPAEGAQLRIEYDGTCFDREG